MWFTCFIVPPLLSTELLREDGHEQDLGSVQGRAPTHHRQTTGVIPCKSEAGEVRLKGLKLRFKLKRPIHLTVS